MMDDSPHRDCGEDYSDASGDAGPHTQTALSADSTEISDNTISDSIYPKTTGTDMLYSDTDSAGEESNLIQNNSSQCVSPCGHEREEKSTFYIYLLTFLSAIGGFLFGYDTGVVSGAMILLVPRFSLSTLWQEVIVSVTIATAAIFSIVGGAINNYYGRKPTILLASITFTIGALDLAFAANRIMLVIGRAVVGVGIGLASMTVPVYIAESAPVHMRGRLVTLNNLFITGGQFVASCLDGAFSYDKENGWRFMFGLAAIPSVVQLVGFAFMPESPRWLISKSRIAEARTVLHKIRGPVDIEAELQAIKQNCADDNRIKQLAGNKSVIKQMFTTPHVRRALLVGCSLQMFQQICGINTVMYYSATIIKMSGIQNDTFIIWLAAVTAGINFVFTIVGLYLVEKVGRRKLTLGSLAGTALSLILLAISFQYAAFQAPAVDLQEDVPYNIKDAHCLKYSTCYDCMSDQKCGFCYQQSGSSVYNSSCLPSVTYSWGQPIGNASLYGRCNGTDVASTSWAYGFCPTSLAWMSTFGLGLYLAFFAPGMGPMPWTINSEIYPLWARSTGNALATTVNWSFNLLISITFLTLTQTITRYGAFWLYAGFAVIGLVVLGWLLPETRGKKLEEVEQLFKKPWCSKQR